MKHHHGRSALASAAMMAGLGPRLAVALGLSMVLWLGVWWCL